MNKRCVSGACRVKVKNTRITDATKITNMVETCMRDRRDLIREGKMRIESETKVASTGSRRDGMTINENNCRIVDFI